MANIRQNLAKLVFAFIYNAAGVPIAAGVLYPIFGILLSPIIAAAAMALSSVCASAMRYGCAPQDFDLQSSGHGGFCHAMTDRSAERASSFWSAQVT